MQFLITKNYIILLLVTLILLPHKICAKNNETLYTEKNISNYFSGVISAKNDNDIKAEQYLSKVQSLQNIHSNYNIEFVRTLVLLEKFDRALVFSKNVWNENELFFEADLLLGLDFFIKKEFKKAEKHFKRLNEISRYNLYFKDFIGNILIMWSKASQGKKNESFNLLTEIPEQYRHLKNTQISFLKCYFDSPDTQNSFQELIQSKDYNFSRYNFFLINYLIFNNKDSQAYEIIKESRKNHSSNLLLKETENFFTINKKKKIKRFFNCKDPKDSIAEFFYIIANLYSSEEDYQLSNFYLKISLLLNKNFASNNALLAENFYYQKKYKLSQKVYKILKLVGPNYFWHSVKSIASIQLKNKNKNFSFSKLEKAIKSMSNLNYEHYYDFANFYKDNEKYEKSIEYYSLALNEIPNENFLIPKILYRRGTSYERLGDWEKAEEDLVASLKILPDQAGVLNYLAYTWIDKGINLEQGMEMLKKANKIREGDGYIIDSLGWAHYALKNYIEAEKFLQMAVELLPNDPIINDHYGDSLWMNNKNIQARYVWKNVLNLENTEKKLKDIVSKKIITGIVEEL